MRVLLVHLPDGAVADPALGQPLGARAQVAARITDLLPGTTFDDGRGTFRRASYAVTFTIGGDEPTVVDVEIDHAEGLTALKRIVDKTGWRVIDPDGPSFVDLDASRAARGLVAASSNEPPRTAASNAAGGSEPPTASKTASSPRPVAGPAPGSGGAPHRRAVAGRGGDAVMGCLVATLGVLFILALPVFVVGPSVLTARSSSLNPISGLAWDVVFAALTAMPLYLVALVLTAIARTRPFGFALAAGCAAATLLVTLPFTSARTPLSSHLFLSTGTVLVAIVAGVQIVLIVAAGRALAAVPLTARRVAAVLVGLLVPSLYAGGVSRAVTSHERTLALEPVLAEKHRIALTQTVDQIRDCVEGYAASYPDRGFPVSLEQLGPKGEQCLSAALAAGQDAGYRFTYFGGVPNEGGLVQLYSVCARPAKFPSDGKETFVANQRSATRIRFGEERDLADSYSCAEAYNEAVAAIEHCAVTYAAAHPQAGYPPTLGDMQGCVMTSGSADFRTHSIVKGDHRYTYIAGPPDERGVIAGFEIYGVNHATYPTAEQFFADQTGVVRVARAQRLATPFDPLEEDDLKAASESHERNRFGPQALTSRCDAGDQVWCLDLAASTRALARQRLPQREAADIDTIVRLYRAACQTGTASACAALGDFFSDNKLVPFDLPRAAPLFDRACEFGNGEACHRLATLLRESLTQRRADVLGRQQRAVQLDQRGCSLRHGESCFALAEMYSQGDALSRPRAPGLLEDSCRFGVAEACHGLVRLKSNDRRLLLKACARGDFPECAALNPVAGRGLGAAGQ